MALEYAVDTRRCPRVKHVDGEHTRGEDDRHRKEKRMSKMKDGREGKLLILWPGRQAWRKGFGLSSGPDPCLLD